MACAEDIDVGSSSMIRAFYINASEKAVSTVNEYHYLVVKIG